jgi:hypothetical protein
VEVLKGDVLIICDDHEREIVVREGIEFSSLIPIASLLIVMTRSFGFLICSPSRPVHIDLVTFVEENLQEHHPK